MWLNRTNGNKLTITESEPEFNLSEMENELMTMPMTETLAMELSAQVENLRKNEERLEDEIAQRQELLRQARVSRKSLQLAVENLESDIEAQREVVEVAARSLETSAYPQ